MPVINLTNPLVTLLIIAAIVLEIYLGYELKKSAIPAVTLFLTVALLVIHTLQLYVFGESYEGYETIISTSMLYDIGFIVISYLSYLWIDDVEAKARNKKSIDNSLDWFWSNV